MNQPASETRQREGFHPLIHLHRHEQRSFNMIVARLDRTRPAGGYQLSAVGHGRALREPSTHLSCPH
jgi:hypothetical protein